MAKASWHACRDGGVPTHQHEDSQNGEPFASRICGAGRCATERPRSSERRPAVPSARQHDNLAPTAPAWVLTSRTGPLVWWASWYSVTRLPARMGKYTRGTSSFSRLGCSASSACAGVPFGRVEARTACLGRERRQGWGGGRATRRAAQQPGARASAQLAPREPTCCVSTELYRMEKKMRAGWSVREPGSRLPTVLPCRLARAGRPASAAATRNGGPTTS